MELNEKLIEAVETNNLKRAEQLVNQGADVLYLNRNYETPLSLSIKNEKMYNLLKRYRPSSSLQSGVNNPKTFYPPNITIRCIEKNDNEEKYTWYGTGLRPNTAYWLAENDQHEILSEIGVVPSPGDPKVPEFIRFGFKTEISEILIEHAKKWFEKITELKAFELYDPRKLISLPFYDVTPEKGKVYFTHSYVKNHFEKVEKELMKKPLPFPFKRDFTTFATLQDYFLELCQLNTKKYIKGSDALWTLDYYIEVEPGTLARISNNGSPEVKRLTSEELVAPLIIPAAFGANEFNEKGNVLVDYFNEGARVECIYDKEGKSLLELYNTKEIKRKIISKALGKYKEISDFSLRHSMYGVISGCNLFKPHLAKAIYDLFEPKKVIDMCSGWGDRLLGAMACETIEEYQGFDPNTKLIPGYKSMIQSFEGVVKGTYNIESIPFENSHLKNDYYDLAFTSPPFFDVEVYTDEKTQSIASDLKDSDLTKDLSPDLTVSDSNLTDLNLWVDTWLYPMMEKAWNALKKGGHLALYINDSKDKLGTSTESGDKSGDKSLCQRMMKHSTNLPGNIFVGIIGVESQRKGKHRLLWVWRKE